LFWKQGSFIQHPARRAAPCAAGFFLLVKTGVANFGHEPTLDTGSKVRIVMSLPFGYPGLV